MLFYIAKIDCNASAHLMKKGLWICDSFQNCQKVLRILKILFFLASNKNQTAMIRHVVLKKKLRGRFKNRVKTCEFLKSYFFVQNHKENDDI